MRETNSQRHSPRLALPSAIAAALLASACSAGTSEPPDTTSRDEIIIEVDLEPAVADKQQSGYSTSYDNPLPLGEPFNAKGWTNITTTSVTRVNRNYSEYLDVGEDRSTNQVWITFQISGTFVGLPDRDQAASNLYDLTGFCDPSFVVGASGTAYKVVQRFASDPIQPPVIGAYDNRVIVGGSQVGSVVAAVDRDDRDFRWLLSPEMCSPISLFVDIGNLP